MHRLEDSDCPSSHTDQEPSSLHPSKLKLTSIDSFWKSVETTAATGKPLPATANYSNSMQHSEPHLQNLRNTIIILPRITTMIRPVMKHYKRNAANHIWQDTAAWSKDLLLEMLNRFLSITGAKTIPDLAEYKVLPDKASCTCTFQSSCSCLHISRCYVLLDGVEHWHWHAARTASGQTIHWPCISQTSPSMALNQHDSGNCAITVLRVLTFTKQQQACIARTLAAESLLQVFVLSK